jgi:hypothetical protein
VKIEMGSVAISEAEKNAVVVDAAAGKVIIARERAPLSLTHFRAI